MSYCSRPLTVKWLFVIRTWFIWGLKRRWLRLDDIYETKPGAAPLTANKDGHCVTKCLRSEWWRMNTGQSSTSKQSKVQRRKAHADIKPSSSNCGWLKQSQSFCLLLATGCNTPSPLFPLWEAQVHKYWLNCCPIMRITNVKPCVDAAVASSLIAAFVKKLQKV